jgi:SM-20-related protein
MKDTPVLEILENFAPADLHAEAWTACTGKGWYFGHGSNDSRDESEPRFWKMDLEDQPAFGALWEHVRARCEELAGAPLRVMRVYANGHTYGLGGQPHSDDHRPGTYTLLYYPMLEWKPAWDGETVFLEKDEVILSVVPRPNRAVFFDSRIAHAGRAPSRACPALRVTVAYKLEAVARTAQPAEPVAEVDDAGGLPTRAVEEIGREGALRRFRIPIPAAEIDGRVDEQLTTLGRSVKLPGFRPGKIPPAVLRQRYGEDARRDVLTRLAIEAANRATPSGGLTSALTCTAGERGGDAVFELAVTMLAELPAPDFSQVAIENLTASDPAAAALCRDHLKQQVLDALAAAYTFPIAPALVEREFAPIWRAAQAQLGSVSGTEREAVAAEFRTIAERRIRLGAVVAETARRRGIRSPESATPETRGAVLEDLVIDALVSEAQVTERAATAEDLARFA